MEIWGTQKSEDDLEKEEQLWRIHISDFKASYGNAVNQ